MESITYQYSQRLSCPLCGGFSRPFLDAIDLNHRISSQSFIYAKCQSCRCVHLLDPPADISSFYQSSYYHIPTFDRLNLLARRDRCKIDTLLKLSTKHNGRLLEIGPAYGLFLLQAMKAGFHVDAIEMDERCCDYLSDVLGLDPIKSDSPVDSLQQLSPYDVIVLSHVLEHIPNPKSLMSALAAKLKPGGIILISMPNPDSWQFSLLGKYWPHLDAPRHLTLMPIDSLANCLAQYGLRLLYYTTNDHDARVWNRFTWQRLLLNACRHKLALYILLAIGYFVSLLMIPFDCRPCKGSTYTAAFTL